MERNKVTIVDHGEEDEDGIMPDPREVDVMLDDDPGYVPCRCEDYPCCGH